MNKFDAIEAFVISITLSIFAVGATVGAAYLIGKLFDWFDAENQNRSTKDD